MNEDEVKMLVAVGKYNGNNKKISSPINGFMEQEVGDEYKNLLPEYIQHMNRIAYFASDYEKNLEKYAHKNRKIDNSKTEELKNFQK